MISKKNITSLILSFLFCMFLVYAGAFRDMSNPLIVTRYYIECFLKRQGFLTYSICKNDIFNEDRRGEIYSKYSLYFIKNIELNLIKMDDTNAQVYTKLIYKDNLINSLVITLEKSDKNWIIVKGFQ